MELSRLSYLQRGEGKDMVFLHGYLSSKECFAAQTAYFSRFCRVTAIDFPGFGGAEPLPEAFSVADYAAWTKGALSALGVERPHVVAHSFGCRVAVKLAAQDPDLFDKILLTGPAGIILRRGAGYRAKVGAYRLVKKIAPRFAERHFGSAEYRTLSPLMRESYKKIVNEDLRGESKTKFSSSKGGRIRPRRPKRRRSIFPVSPAVGCGRRRADISRSPNTRWYSI